MVIRQSQEIVASWNLVWPVDTEIACVVEKAWPGFPHSSVVKNPPAMQETPVQFLGQEDLLEKG